MWHGPLCTGPCGFESSSLCGFDQDISDKTYWLHMNVSTGHVDHTYRTQMGESLAICVINNVLFITHNAYVTKFFFFLS